MRVAAFIRVPCRVVRRGAFGGVASLGNRASLVYGIVAIL